VATLGRTFPCRFLSTTALEHTGGRKNVITKDMKIEEVLRKHPQTIPTFERFGIDCAECQLSEFENLEHGARVHGIDLPALLKALNESIRKV
jgi:hybrid cluster-associated redox disulfide protein